jgi:putative FmdB family regulatory protein
MPLYEYRCPNGHTFEVIHRMADPGPSICEVCGESPVEKVLYPAAIHFKGSGFYSTDYGRGGRRRDGGESSSDSGGDRKSDSGGDAKSDSKPPEKKTADAGS